MFGLFWWLIDIYQIVFTILELPLDPVEFRALYNRVTYSVSEILGHESQRPGVNGAINFQPDLVFAVLDRGVRVPAANIQVKQIK